MSRSRRASSASAALLNSAQSVRGKIELDDGSGAILFSAYIADFSFDFRHARQAALPVL
jgi:hypothetical protein